MGTVETKRAVHVALFARLVQPEFATATRLSSSRVSTTPDAVLGAALDTGFRVTGPYFERGDKGRDKVELAQGTEILAESGAPENVIYQQRRGKVGNDEPCGQPGLSPEIEQFVGK